MKVADLASQGWCRDTKAQERCCAAPYGFSSPEARHWVLNPLLKQSQKWGAWYILANKVFSQASYWLPKPLCVFFVGPSAVSINDWSQTAWLFAVKTAGWGWAILSWWILLPAFAVAEQKVFIVALPNSSFCFGMEVQQHAGLQIDCPSSGV